MNQVSRNKNDLISELSPHIFWNCDSNILDYKKNKDIIIERIIKYGLESDIIIMWKLYNRREIIKTAVNIDMLDQKRMLYYSLMLGIKEKKFKCYRKNLFQVNY